MKSIILPAPAGPLDILAALPVDAGAVWAKYDTETGEIHLSWSTVVCLQVREDGIPQAFAPQLKPQYWWEAVEV